MAAASPTHQTFSLLGTTKVGVTRNARRRVPGLASSSSASVPTAVMPPAHTTAAASSRSPSANRIACASTSTTERSNSTSTPIALELAATRRYSRARETRVSSSSAMSTRRTAPWSDRCAVPSRLMAISIEFRERARRLDASGTPAHHDEVDDLGAVSAATSASSSDAADGCASAARRPRCRAASSSSARRECRSTRPPPRSRPQVVVGNLAAVLQDDHVACRSTALHAGVAHAHVLRVTEDGANGIGDVRRVRVRQ